MNFIEAADLKICYELKGSGYPLVMIMGFAGNIDWWDPEFLDALSARYRLLVFDSRGSGRTVTPADGQFSIEMFADDTALLMSKLGIEQAHVFGFSMGGLIAQMLALRHPEKVNRLVLGGTFCGGRDTVMPSKEISKMLTDTTGGIDGVCERTLKLMFPDSFIESSPEFAKSFSRRFKTAPISPSSALRQIAAIAQTSTLSRLPEIKKPVLVACGTDDILIPRSNSQIIAENIPGSKLIEYKGAGHSFMSSDMDEFVKDLIEFLG